VKKYLKIDQYLATIWTKVCGLVFKDHPVDHSIEFSGKA